MGRLGDPLKIEARDSPYKINFNFNRKYLDIREKTEFEA